MAIDTLLDRVYQSAPESTRPAMKRVYNTLSPSRHTDTDVGDILSDVYGVTVDYPSRRAEFESLVTAWAGDEDPELWFSNMPWGVTLDDAAVYFAIIRELKPSCIVETGVFNGASTTAMLLALRENETGELHSVDIGAADLPSERRSKLVNDEIGGIIPDELRSDWTFHEGASQDILPKLLVNLGEIDMFIHDSEHTLPCMVFEYECAWRHLVTGGALLSDGVHCNVGFDGFCEERAQNWDKIKKRKSGRIGVAVKD